jgi:hypothetical protein
MSVAAPSLNLSPNRAAVNTGPADTGRNGVTILDFASHSAPARGDSARTTIRAPRVHAVQLHDELWRVTRPDGEVVGYIERFAESRGIRFRAKRLIVRQQRFVPIGEFWSMDDALAVL